MHSWMHMYEAKLRKLMHSVTLDVSYTCVDIYTYIYVYICAHTCNFVACNHFNIGLGT